jgi:alpha-mannosidase/mannosylglycerate hydrolase
MPQIMRGFCIGKTMLLRGTNAEGEQSEMLWTGADGTRVWILKVFPDTGYCDVWTYRREENPDKLRAYEARKVELSTTPVLIGLDGNDHQAPFGPIRETIQRMGDAFENTRVRHSSMTEALGELDKHLDLGKPGNRRQFTGELRTAAKTGMWNEVFFGTASARMPTKQKNDLAQRLLSRVAEPLHALASLQGGDPDRKFLDLAWEYLLKCHPHDSIVGCSTDQVDRDVHYRLDQAIELARDGAGEAMMQLAQAASGSLGSKERGPAVFLFNPAQANTGAVNRITVETTHVPGKRPRRPVLVDEYGNRVEADLTLVESGVFPEPIARPITHTDYPRYGCRAHEEGPVDRWEGPANVAVPAFGYRVLKVCTSAGRAAAPVALEDAVTYDPEAHVLSNGRIAIEIGPAGLFSLKDLSSGYRYKGQGAFEWAADKGNGWDFKPVDTAADPNRPAEIIPLEQAKVGVVRESALEIVLRVSGTLRIPAGLDSRGAGVSRRRVRIKVAQEIALAGGDAFARLAVRIDNHARDFRLRMLFPTGLQANNWWSDSAFDVVKRPIQLPDTTGWKEQARPETPIHNFAAVCDNSNGLAVVTHGLQEACVLDVPERPIALTLMRCYSQKIGSGRTEATQLQGPFTATFHIGPFAPENSAPPFGLLQDFDRLKLPLQCLTLAPGEAGEAMDGGEMPAGPCLDLSGKLLLSGFYREANRIIARVWNPTQTPQGGSITCHIANIQKALPVNLAGQPEGASVDLTDGRLDLQLPPKAIQTWRFDLHAAR